MPKITNNQDLDESYVYCDHCDHLVSRSTYERHQKKRKLGALKASRPQRALHAQTSDSSSEDETVFSSTDKSSPRQKTSVYHADDFNNQKSSSSSEDESGQESNEFSSIFEPMSSSEELHSDNDQHGHNSFISSSDSEEEVWSGVLPENIERDIHNAPPVPEAVPNARKVQRINSLVFWFVYFLLIWQVTCHISDNGMAWLLRFIVAWLKVLGVEMSNEVLSRIITLFPGSVYLMRQFLNIDRDNFNKFVVCPKCCKLYRYDSCLEIINGKQCAKRCTNSYYIRGRRKTCNAHLLTKVSLKDGKYCFYPIYYYCCKSIIESLEQIVQRKGIAEKCEQWRTRNVPEDIMADVYDGQLWKDFQTVKGKDFLKSPRNYGMMLNFDFFQPMKHRKDYSVGVFYLVLLNLPRSMRYKWENVIIVGIVPSMDKEPKNLNEFLEPAVIELQKLWKGVRMTSSLSTIPLTFRAAIISTSSDIPATRKLCGFKSHSALLGCSKCLKMFPGNFGEKRDYSGFERSTWKPRTHEEHRRQAEKIRKSKTKAQQQSLGAKAGIAHYSILLQLEYIDIIRFSTIDPMHNLFLGTAKKMWHLWNDNKLFSKKQLEEIEKRIESFTVPTDIGRLPKNIITNAGTYTAEQWKNWTLLYSLYCLEGILPLSHYKCWHTFVLACSYICKPVLSKADLQIADGVMLKFCMQVEKLYGKSSISPNIHLHCHLKDVLLDHGPASSFWCFSFERFNGILGSTPTNKRSLELQIMRRFVISRYFDDGQLPLDFRNEFVGICSLNSSIDESEDKTDYDGTFQKIATHCPLNGIDWKDNSGIKLPSFHKVSHFDTDDMHLLLEVYKLMYPTLNLSIGNLCETFNKFGSIVIGPSCYGSNMEPRRIRSSHVLASWSDGNGNVNTETFHLCAGCIKYFICHSVKLDKVYGTHYFAVVNWYKEAENCYGYGNPLKVWDMTFQDPGPSSFIPVQRLHSRFAFTNIKRDGAVSKLVSSPITRIEFY